MRGRGRGRGRENRTNVVCCVRVVVYASKKGRRRILADVFLQEMGTTGMFVDEGANVVDEAGNEDKSSCLRLVLDCTYGEEGFSIRCGSVETR